MVTAGTVSNVNPAVSPVRSYGRLLLPLTTALAKLPADITEWSSRARLKVYTEVVEAATRTARPEVSSALSSFQQYLEEHFELPTISTGQRPTSNDIGRANLIWPRSEERRV